MFNHAALPVGMSVARLQPLGPTNSPENEYTLCSPARVKHEPMIKSTSQHLGLAPSGKSWGLQFVTNPPYVSKEAVKYVARKSFPFSLL